MRIGIYGSSFDPITNVHLWTASTIYHRAQLDKVIFLPCSMHRNDKDIQADSYHRCEMVRLAIKNDDRFEVDTYELDRPAWESYTLYTMRYFRGKYPNDDVFFIMGADCLKDIGDGKWQHGGKLVAENKFIVMSRGNINMLRVIARSSILRPYDNSQRFTLIDKGLDMEISSTYIREEIEVGGNPRYLLPDVCYTYIMEHGLYRREQKGNDQHGNGTDQGTKQHNQVVKRGA